MRLLRNILLCFLIFLSFNVQAQQSKDTINYNVLKARLEKLQNPLPKPGPNDWLSRNYEAGQTFEVYRKFRNPLSVKQLIIYLKQVGNFDSDETQIFDLVKTYLNVFYQTEVKVEEKQKLDQIPNNYQRERFGHIQVKTPYIFSFLPRTTKESELAYLALTNVDIYPNDAMNFVFGQAVYSTGIGVTSMFRLKVVEDDTVNVKKSAIRIAKTASHEIGHMIGINHCTAFSCVMNGANNNEEADRQPMHFCSECTLKLIWYLDLDFTKRSNDLKNLWKEWDIAENKRYYKASITI